MVALKTEQIQETLSGKLLVGEVVSDKMDKTIVVNVIRTLRHPIYAKIVRRHKKFKVHDEQNTAKVGDHVEIKECRPLSREKHMTLVRILSKD